MEEDQTNLIVNYLPQTLDDDKFQAMFSTFGPLKSSKIVRDKATGYSYGFGFVDYMKHDHALKAIEQLNGHRMEHKTIKVAFARKNDEQSKGANLYVQNLPMHFRESELSEEFCKFGEIVQTRVLTDRVSGQSKGVGFVLYSKRSEAESAMIGMNGKVPTGGTQAMSIKFADDNAKKVKPPPQNFYATPRYPMHGSYGPMGGMGPRPMRNSGNRFRFNPMSSSGGYAGGYNPSASNAPGHILFVYNIGNEADEKTLWQLFAPLGTVTKVNVIMDHQRNQCKGYGFVTMPNIDEAENAILNLNGFMYNGKQLSVSFKT